MTGFLPLLSNVTATDVANQVWATVLDGAYTARDITRLNASILVSKVSGAGTGTEVFRDISDTKNRVSATVDINGNRTAITLDPA